MMIEDHIEAAKKRTFRRMTDYEWCTHAYQKDTWTLFLPVYFYKLDQPECFEHIAETFRNMEKDGWKYASTEADGDVLAIEFQCEAPVTDDDRQKAKEWLANTALYFKGETGELTRIG